MTEFDDQATQKLPRLTEDQKQGMMLWLTHWLAVFAEQVSCMENLKDEIPAVAYSQYRYWQDCVRCVKYLLAQANKQQSKEQHAKTLERRKISRRKKR